MHRKARFKRAQIFSHTKYALMGSRPLQERFARPANHELKQKSVNGAIAVVAAQGVKVALGAGTLILLARLLSPEDFGLAAMAATLTNFLSLFRDAGLSAATVQRPEVTHGQVSTLFWVNVALGIGMSFFTILLAPALVYFYGSPQLYWLVVVSGASFFVQRPQRSTRGVARSRDALRDAGEH